MATEKQIEANRQNATHSTGPKTPEGKAKSRLNATTHGLAGELTPVEAGLEAEFNARREAWGDEHRPVGDSAGFALDRLVASSMRIDQCNRALNGVIARHSARAKAAWSDDRALEAAELSATLAKNPAVVALRLASTRAGCQQLLGLWGRLAEALYVRKVWNDAETSLALDLLAVPLDLREETTALESFDETPRLAHLTSIVAGEIDRLKARLTRLTPVDDLDRRQAEAGDVALLSKPAQLMIRYERDAWRRFNAAMKDLRTPPADEPVKPKSKFAPDPEPNRDLDLDFEFEFDHDRGFDLDLDLDLDPRKAPQPGLHPLVAETNTRYGRDDLDPRSVSSSYADVSATRRPPNLG